MGLVLLKEVCVVSLLSGENLTLRFSFEEVPVKVTGRRFLANLVVLEMVDCSVVLGM